MPFKSQDEILAGLSSSFCLDVTGINIQRGQNFINLQSLLVFGPPHAAGTGAGLAEEGFPASIGLKGDSSSGEQKPDLLKEMLSGSIPLKRNSCVVNLKF